MYTATIRSLGAGLCVLLTACAHSPVNDPSDPFEGFNRGVFAFNEKLDQYIAKPAAQGYKAAVPEVARSGIGNFIANAMYSTVIVNDILQWKMLQSAEDLARFAFNTIVGLGGFVDAAKMIGLEKHNEDFGQTLGYWGIGNGAFLMLPLYGPSSNRELVGSAAGFMTDPTTYLPMKIAAPFNTAAVIDTRTSLLDFDGVLAQQLDRYIFVRNAYLQQRQNLVYDGSPPIEQSDLDEEPEQPKR
jgi:phospholipid-binding lipoprotein MlaA